MLQQKWTRTRKKETLDSFILFFNKVPIVFSLFLIFSPMLLPLYNKLLSSRVKDIERYTLLVLLLLHLATLNKISGIGICKCAHNFFPHTTAGVSPRNGHLYR